MSNNTKDGYHKGKKKNYYANDHKVRRQKRYLQPGCKGFLATCNFREQECIRECINVLNHYADFLYGPDTKLDISSQPSYSINSDEEDIASQLENEVEALNAKQNSGNSEKRFQVADVGIQNNVFIKTNLPDTVELALQIVRDIAKSMDRRTRFVLRLVPIEQVCKANIRDITDAAGILFDKYFLKEPKTYSIICNRRCNNSISRDQIINKLASLVATKNIGNKADLKNPQLAVVVEIIKGLCLISVIPDYFVFKKFNLNTIFGEFAREDIKQDVHEKPEDIVAEIALKE